MKKQFFSIQSVAITLGVLLISGAAHAASLTDLELHGYLRAGVRSNSGVTSVNECYSNKPAGMGGNEFRLGNECGQYGELNFTAWQLKGKEATDPFFKTNITFQFFTDSNIHEEVFPSRLFEAFVEGGNFFGSSAKYWAGKRVYRDASVHMNDEFYFANINGNGAGVTDIGLGSGSLAVAYFLQQNGATFRKEHLLDARYTNLILAEHNKLDLWAAYAISDSIVPNVVDNTMGYALGVKHKYDFANGSLNAFSLQYGAKNLQGLTLPDTILVETKNPAAGASLVADQNRFRIVEDVVYQVTDFTSFEFSAKFEKFSGTNTTDKGTWWNVGARPQHFFNQYLGAIAEFGVSSVKFDSNLDATLMKRLTVGPVLALNPKYFARPQIRAYYTTTFERGNAFGAQGEVWF